MLKINYYKNEILPWFVNYNIKIAGSKSLINDLKKLFPKDNYLIYTKDNQKKLNGMENLWYEPSEQTYVDYYMYKVQADVNDEETTKYGHLECICIMERGHNFPKSYCVLYECDNNGNNNTIIGSICQEGTVKTLLNKIRSFDISFGDTYSFGDKMYRYIDDLKSYAEKQLSKII